MHPEIVLIGYYGKANFGDDVLLKVSHALARQILPSAAIAVRAGSEADYFDRLLGEPVTFLPFGTRENHELIIHGGGGNFFDFATHGLGDRILNRAFFSPGVEGFIRLEALARRINGRSRLSAQHRIGLGIGIGTFTPGSPRLREALPVLAEFDSLWLRDPDSQTNLDLLGVRPPTVNGSDLAFLWEHWCPTAMALAPRRKRAFRPSLGLILRDWPSGSGEGFATALRPAIAYLSARYDLTVISLDAATDAGSISALRDLPLRIWEPSRNSIADFAATIAAQDVLITSRAHGAICGACLGRPSVVLGIEPKLHAVHRMLPKATRFALPSTNPVDLAELVQEALDIADSDIAADALRNRVESERALAVVMGKIK